jgi:hypothetical protein
MGESSAETVREIEDIRERLDADARELQERLPAPAAWAKRLAGLAVGGGMGGTVFWFAVRRVRSKRKAKAEAERARAVVQLLPDRWSTAVSEALEDGRWRAWAAGLAGAWMMFRLAELRQLRRLNRALISAR